MRVLNSVTDPRIGGPQIRALAVARELRDQGVQTEFLLPDGDDEFSKQAHEAGFTVHQPGLSRIKPPLHFVSNLQYTAEFPKAVGDIRSLIKEREIDVVHANTSINVEAALATRFSPASLVWHFNDVTMPRPITWVTSTIATRIADETVVASRSVADHYFGNTSCPVNVIYAPVDVREFDPDESTADGVREELGIGEGTTIVGTVGNVNPVKGHMYLVRAAETLKTESDGDIVVLIAGKIVESRGKYFHQLQSLRENLNVKDVVHFLGRRNDVPSLLSAFDVFVLPSTAEACPMAVLEAMAAEKPIVASNVGGIPEQIDDGESGWLVPAENPSELAKAILDTLDDENEARRRGKNARQKAVETFSLERCVERHVTVYNKAAEEH